MATYTDISLTFKAHPGTGDMLKKTDVDAVKVSIKNVLLSGPFDSPFDATYGGNISGMLFETLTPSTIALFKRNLLAALNEHEPRVVVEDIYVGQDVDTNELDVGILFYVIGNPSKQTISLTLDRVQ